MRTAIRTLVGVALLACCKSAQAQDSWHLRHTIDLEETLGTRVTLSGIEYVPSTGTLFLSSGLSQGQFTEMSVEGTVLNQFDVAPFNLDNGGMVWAASAGALYWVNGLGSVNPEPIYEFDTVGNLSKQYSSPVVEGCALGVDPVSGHFFVIDVTSGSRTFREVRREGCDLQQVAAYSLPSDVFGYADAGLTFNSNLDMFVSAGERASHNGVIFSLTRHGEVWIPYFDTGTDGIAGIALDEGGEQMFVLTRFPGDGGPRQVRVYDRDFHLTASPFAVNGGDTLTFAVDGGIPGTIGFLYLSEVDGVAGRLKLAPIIFDSQGRWNYSVSVPPGLVFDGVFEALGRSLLTGDVSFSNLAKVRFE